MDIAISKRTTASLLPHVVAIQLFGGNGRPSYEHWLPPEEASLTQRQVPETVIVRVITSTERQGARFNGRWARVELLGVNADVADAVAIRQELDDGIPPVSVVD